MKTFIVKEDKLSQYIYMSVGMFILSPVTLVRGYEDRSILMMLIGTLGLIYSMGIIYYYNKRKKGAYLLKLDAQGIHDYPFFKKERLIKWSNVESIDLNFCLMQKKLEINIRDKEMFIDDNKNKINGLERMWLKWTKPSYNIGFISTSQSPEEVMRSIKTHLKTIRSEEVSW